MLDLQAGEMYAIEAFHFAGDGYIFATKTDTQKVEPHYQTGKVWRGEENNSYIRLALMSFER